MNFIFAGFADQNASLFRRIGVPLGDPAAFLQLDNRTIALVRDLEMDRVRKATIAAETTCPADHAPPSGLSADRETATAQAAAQIVLHAGIKSVTVDRSLPYLFAWHLQQLDIEVQYDPSLGVADRRSKTPQEIESLAQAQATTESVMQQLCEMIAMAATNEDGTLQHNGEPLTSELVRSMAAIEFLNRDYSMGHGAIAASAPHSGDCHHRGSGPLRTGVPIIIDLFPRCEATRYWGDCTRTVVHGQPTDDVLRMHAAIVEAKEAATSIMTTGVSTHNIHQAAEAVLLSHGYENSRGTITDKPSIQHGTGHAIGLDLHEPMLLDDGGGETVDQEVFTVEPGLYGRSTGGIRIEDMIVVTNDGPRNLNRLPQGLDWRVG